MEETREGGCQCGKLRYAISGERMAASVCHCPDCRQQSGSAFGMSLVLPRDAFRWLAGEPRAWTTTAASGASKECVFCPDCGVRILNLLGSMPDTVNLKPGTLDDSSWVRPALEVWVSNKQPWVQLPEGLPSFEKNPR